MYQWDSKQLRKDNSQPTLYCILKSSDNDKKAVTHLKILQNRRIKWPDENEVNYIDKLYYHKRKVNK